MTTTTTPRTSYYYPPPPIIRTYKPAYQNVNNDENLQTNVTNYFLDKSINWIKKDNKYKHMKKYLSVLQKDNGFNIIHNILKQLVRQGKTNWYDLRVQESLVKSFIKYKLSN